MNKAYEMLKGLSIDELKKCIDEAPLHFIRGWKGNPSYHDLYALECLFVYQCRETIRRKEKGIW